MSDFVDLPNFENVQPGRAMLDDGTYTVNCRTPFTKDTQNDKMFLQAIYHVVAGPEQKAADENGSHNPVGREIRDRLYLNPESLWKLKRALIAGGIIARDDKSSDAARGKFPLGVMVGTTFQVRLVKGTNPNTGREVRNVEYLI